MLHIQSSKFEIVLNCNFLIVCLSKYLNMFLSTFLHTEACKVPLVQSLCVDALSADFGKLFDSHEHSDIILKCGEHLFPVHRSILSARSQFFSAMFHSQTPDTVKEIVIIDDIEPISLYYILRYIYSGIIESPLMDVVISLFQVAHKYGIHSLKRKCSSLIAEQLSGDTIFTALLLADQYCDQELFGTGVAFATSIDGFLTSKQWDAFSENHSQLAVKVYKKFSKK